MTESDAIGRTERSEKPPEEDIIGTPCPLGADDGLRPVFSYYLKKFFRNSIQGFIPIDSLPFVLTLRTGSFQRILEPIRMVEQLRRCLALHADLAS